MIERAIWLALKSRIESLPIDWPKAYPGERFTPTVDPFFRIGMVSSDPERTHIDNGKPYVRTGSLMVTLVIPTAGSGVFTTGRQYQHAGTVAGHFPDSLKIHHSGVCVSITNYPQVLDGYLDNAYWNIPVRITWRCYK